nr:MAG TPA: hypothetical protein [Crassvirales sp.]
MVCKHILALFNFSRESQGSRNHKTCVIPFYRFIESDFALNNSLIHGNIRDKFLLRSSTIQSNENHLEKPSLSKRAIH